VTIQSAHWQSVKVSNRKTARALVLGFSGALEPGPAQNLGNYNLVALEKGKKPGSLSSKLVNLTAAAYSATTDTVALIPRGAVPNRTLRLTVVTAGILDAAGVPVDANASGQPGANLVVTLGSKGGVNLAGIAPALSAKAVDAVLASM
jgi:hypothetical protein